MFKRYHCCVDEKAKIINHTERMIMFTNSQKSETNSASKYKPAPLAEQQLQVQAKTNIPHTIEEQAILNVTNAIV